MNHFCHSTAKIAAWNLAGFFGIPDERLELQVEGLALLDAEVVVLVEINPLNVLEKLKEGLAKKGCIYESSIIPQANKLNIGVLFKEGVIATNPRLMDGSDLGDTRKRKAFMVDIKVGKFDFLLIAVILSRVAAPIRKRSAMNRQRSLGNLSQIAGNRAVMTYS